jgi:hypothetical protein
MSCDIKLKTERYLIAKEAVNTKGIIINEQIFDAENQYLTNKLRTEYRYPTATPVLIKVGDSYGFNENAINHIQRVVNVESYFKALGYTKFPETFADYAEDTLDKIIKKISSKRIQYQHKEGRFKIAYDAFPTRNQTYKIAQNVVKRVIDITNDKNSATLIEERDGTFYIDVDIYNASALKNRLNEMHKNKMYDFGLIVLDRYGKLFGKELEDLPRLLKEQSDKVFKIPVNTSANIVVKKDDIYYYGNTETKNQNEIEQQKKNTIPSFESLFYKKNNGEMFYAGELVSSEKKARQLYEEDYSSNINKENKTNIKPGVEELFNENPELAAIGTLQLYSQYLESLNKPNTNPILKGNQQEQVKKFAELQERLSNKEFIEGAKGAWESTSALQEFGTQEEYNDYIARVSLGIIKNPTSSGYNYTSQVKDIVYHGSQENFEEFDVNRFIDETSNNPLLNENEIQTLRNNKNSAYYFSNKKELALTYGGVLKSVILNIENLKTIEGNNALWNRIVDEEASELLGETFENTTRGFEYDYKRKGKHLLNKGILFKNIYDQGSGKIFEHLSDVTLVYSSKQIHTLGSKQDIEGFKEFLSQNNNNNSSTNKVGDILKDSKGNNMLFYYGTTDLQSEERKPFNGLLGYGYYLTNNKQDALFYAKQKAKKRGGNPVVKSYNVRSEYLEIVDDPDQITNYGDTVALSNFREIKVNSLTQLVPSSVNVSEKVEQDLKDLNITDDVVNYLYNKSFTKLTKEQYKKEVINIVSLLRTSSSYEEIIDQINCL